MNKHRARTLEDYVPHEPRFYPPEATIPIPKGCYVDGCQFTLAGGNLQALNVAWGMGALDRETYEALSTQARLHEGAFEQMALSEEILAYLNEANLDAEAAWQWQDGDLHYG